jgi:uncharacterized protein YcgL (UPF0745 family)
MKILYQIMQSNRQNKSKVDWWDKIPELLKEEVGKNETVMMNLNLTNIDCNSI